MVEDTHDEHSYFGSVWQSTTSKRAAVLYEIAEQFREMIYMLVPMWKPRQYTYWHFFHAANIHIGT